MTISRQNLQPPYKKREGERTREREGGGGGGERERDITLEYPKLILIISHTSTVITKEAQNS